MVEGPKTTAPDNIPDLDPDRLKVAPNSSFKDLVDRSIKSHRGRTCSNETPLAMR